MPIWLKVHPSGCTLSLHIQPGASSTMVSGLHGDRLKIKVKGEPKDNEANECLIEFLSEKLKVAKKKKIQILKGESSRQKLVLVELPPEDIIAFELA